MTKTENTLRLVLLDILMFGDSKRTEADYQKLLREVRFDVDGDVAEGWLRSHGFMEEGA